MRRLHVALCVASISLSGQAPSVSGRISGVITESGSQVPIGSVIVTARSPRLGPVGSAITSRDGHFSIAGLPLGSFLLTASKPGYLSATYGSSAVGEPGIPLILAGDRLLQDVQMSMVRGAVVFGEIRDGRGQLERQAEVTLFRMARLGEEEVGEQVSTVRTDDRGRYRFFGVPPGLLVVSVKRTVLSAGGVPTMSDDDVDQMLLWLQQGHRVPQLSRGAPKPGRIAGQAVPVYFPGGSPVGPSGALSIDAGSEHRLDLVLPESESGTVSGTVRGLPSGATASVMLEAVHALRIEGPRRTARTVTTSENGGFSFPGVSPGSYVVTARAAEPGGSSRMLWAIDRVDVAEGREISIALGLTRAATVAGRVVVAPSRVGSEEPREIEIRLISSTMKSAPWADQRTLMTLDGRFTFNAVPPGSYRVSVEIRGQRSAWVSESARCGLVDALDVPCDLPLAEDIVVQVTDQLSGIAGHLDSGEGMLPSDFQIVAFPTTEADWVRGGRRLKQVRPGADGQFQCDLPSGVYYVGVISPVASEAVTSELLRRLAFSSVRVVVPPRQIVRQGLRVAK